MLCAITKRSARLSAAMAMGAIAGVAGAGTTTYVLSDHPNSIGAPPPYGLRLDGLFGGMAGAVGDVTTFSFDHPMADMRLVVNDNDPGNITINIFGTAFGGEDVGAAYGFGEGLYEIDFTYAFNVMESGEGWEVLPSDSGNEGAITSLGNSDVAAGTTFEFFEEAPSDNNFAFRRDGFRLSSSERDALGNPFVGRAWVTMLPDGAPSDGIQDWLFIGQIIPTPTAVGLGACGLLAGFAARRRRGA